MCHAWLKGSREIGKRKQSSLVAKLQATSSLGASAYSIPSLDVLLIDHAVYPLTVPLWVPSYLHPALIAIVLSYEAATCGFYLSLVLYWPLTPPKSSPMRYIYIFFSARIWMLCFLFNWKKIINSTRVWRTFILHKNLSLQSFAACNRNALMPGCLIKGTFLFSVN